MTPDNISSTQMDQRPPVPSVVLSFIQFFIVFYLACVGMYAHEKISPPPNTQQIIHK